MKTSTQVRTQVSTRTAIVVVAVAATALALAAYGYGFAVLRTKPPKFKTLSAPKAPSASQVGLAPTTGVAQTLVPFIPPKNNVVITQRQLDDQLPNATYMQNYPQGKLMDVASFKAEYQKDPAFPENGRVSIKQFQIKIKLNTKNVSIGKFKLKDVPGDQYTIQGYKVVGNQTALYPDVKQLPLLTPFNEPEEFIMVFAFKDEYQLPDFGTTFTVSALVNIDQPTGEETVLVSFGEDASALKKGYLLNNRQAKISPVAYSPVSPSIFVVDRSEPPGATVETIQGEDYIGQGVMIFSDNSRADHSSDIGANGGSPDWFIRAGLKPMYWTLKN